MSMPRLAQNPESPATMPDWSRHTTSMEYGNSSVRGARGSVRFMCSDSPVDSPRRCSSLSSLASECQLPRYQHQDGEFVAEAGHAALADGPAAVRDYAGQVVDHPGAIAANGGYGEVLLHLGASVPQHN